MTGPVPASRSTVLCSAWATPADVPDPHRDRLDDETWERLLMQASEIMWALSGRRWYGGGCEETAMLRSMPPTAGRDSWPYDASWGSCPCWRGGTWVDDLFLPRTDYTTAHLSPVAIKLPRNPVTLIVEATVDGITLDPSAYRLTRSGWLERIDGGHWAVCGDSTDVTYQFGEPPPEGGVQAVVLFAIQLMLDYLGDAKCRLPARVTSVTRQGVTMAMLDPMEFLPDGKTGIYLIDLWLASVNPLHRPARGFFFSLDTPTTVKGTTTDAN